MSMTATLIIALATTGVSLAGLMIGLVAWLRADIRRMEDRLRDEAKSMEDRIENRLVSMEGKLTALEGKLTALEGKLTALERSQAKLEGLLEGLREAISLRSAA